MAKVEFARGGGPMKSSQQSDADEAFEPCFLRWSIDFSPELRRKFCEVRDKGYVKEFPEYLSILEEILKKPCPEKNKFEKYMPVGIEVRSKYLEILDGIETIPDDEPSRSTLIKMCGGPDYRNYRKEAREMVERLSNLRKLSYSTHNNKMNNKSSEPGFLGKLHNKLGAGPYIVFVTHLYLTACFLITFGLMNLL